MQGSTPTGNQSSIKTMADIGSGPGAGPFPGFSTAAPTEDTASSAPGSSAFAARADHAHGTNVADWGTPGSLRFFACDTAAGLDTNAGFSDVSQAAAGLVAVKTIARLLSIIPRWGNGRRMRAAIKAGNYASDTLLVLQGFQGYQQALIIGTATNATAGATAFAGDGPDTILQGMTTATGMNAGGYNPIGGSTTQVLIAQLNGGGAPAFPAAPARPYGCRIRFDVATTTVALRNFCSSALLATGGNTLKLAGLLPAAPAASDIFYIEMPNVTGPTSTVLNYTGGDGIGNPSFQLAGLSLGTVNASKCRLRIGGCEAAGFNATNCDLFISDQTSNVPLAFVFQGTALRCTSMNSRSGSINLLAFSTTSVTTPNVHFSPAEMVWERSSAGAGHVFYGNAIAVGNNIIDTIGTNSSFNHGGDCEIWGPMTPPAGTLACGLFLSHGNTLGRIHFSNMGANPCVRFVGSGLGINILGITGGIADGNTDVGLDLSPAGLSGNTTGAMGCTITLVGTPAATGTAGDVRLAGGQIVTWAGLLASGMTDTEGNRITSGAGSPPLAVVGKFSGVIVTSGGGATSTDLGDPGSQPAIAANSSSNNEYPTSARIVTRLRVCAITGNGATAYTVTLHKRPNGGARAATAMQVTVTAGAATFQTFADVVHPIVFADGDTYALQVDSGATGEGNKIVNATLEGPV